MSKGAKRNSGSAVHFQGGDLCPEPTFGTEKLSFWGRQKSPIFWGLSLKPSRAGHCQHCLVWRP